MAADRAIDKLRKAYNVENRSSYAIYKGDELVLKIFWSPLTIADRDNINNTLRALNKGDEEGNLDFALQVIIQKAQDEAGKLLFSEADRPALRREVPLAVLLDIMGKMQDVGDEVDPDAVKSPVEEG
jgi:uncharacterized protein with von Willebrand factor type A (vWA) domain